MNSVTGANQLAQDTPVKESVLDASTYKAEFDDIMGRYNSSMIEAAQADRTLDGPAELRDAKRALSIVCGELRQLRRRVISTEKEIRAMSAAATGQAAVQPHFWVHLLAGRSAASQARAHNKREIARGKAEVLKPYGSIKLEIDEALRQMAVASDAIKQKTIDQRPKTGKTIHSKASNLPRQLRELAELRGSGALTVEEFDAAKRKLIES